MEQFWQLLSISDVFSEGIQVDFCLQALTGGFSEERLGLIRQVIMGIDNYSLFGRELKSAHQVRRNFAWQFCSILLSHILQ